MSYFPFSFFVVSFFLFILLREKTSSIAEQRQLSLNEGDIQTGWRYGMVERVSYRGSRGGGREGGREGASNEFRELISLPPFLLLLLLPLSLQPTVPFAASEAGGTTLIF